MTRTKTKPAEVAATEIRFEELFNMADIQRLQDAFAAATGVASIITRVDGTPITQPSNFCRLCRDIIRPTERGYANCCKSDAALGQFYAKVPTIEPCISGLLNAGAGIFLEGRPIANWLIGQVRDETRTEAEMLEYAREIGADTDETDFLAAYREVPSMSKEKLTRIASALFETSGQLSALAYQNVQQARLITRLHEVEAALQQANETLTGKVEEKTQELLAANEELMAQNQELTAMNEEITAMNDYIADLNQDLSVLNKSLEHRVAERTVDLAAAEQELSAQVEELKRSEEILSESEARYRAVMEQAAEAVIICDPDTGEIVEANSRFTDLCGYNLSQDAPLFVYDLHAASLAEIDVVLAQAKQNSFLPVQRRVLRHKDGPLVCVERSATRVHYRNQNLLVLTLRDVSDEVRREQAEQFSATHDELTGLYNRRGFAEALAYTLESGHGGALLLLDIDDFKSINDVHGRAVGDQYLSAFAAHLRDNIPAATVIARFGGDEFLLFFAGPAGLSAATEAGERLEIVCLETTEGSFFAQLSGGITLLTEPSAELEPQIQQAYLALHQAKASGKWCIKSFEPSLQDQVSRRHAIKTAMGHAIENHELYLAFQPIYNISQPGGNITGYEALLRWTHPELGILSPAEFIPIAEESGLILPIGKWVLREACRFSVNLGKLFGAAVNVAVNISMRQLMMPHFVEMVKEILLETGLPAAKLGLEVTESLLMIDAATRISDLQKLRDLGIAISLDDFGTGYSSFTYLAKMPITILKIDKSMVDEITTGGNGKSLLLLESLLQIGALLGYLVVAEGVETEEQLQFLRSKGCVYSQGFLLSRPLTEAAVLAMLTERAAKIQ